MSTSPGLSQESHRSLGSPVRHGCQGWIASLLWPLVICIDIVISFKPLHWSLPAPEILNSTKLKCVRDSTLENVFHFLNKIRWFYRSVHSALQTDSSQQINMSSTHGGSWTKIIQFGFKDYVVDDALKKRAEVRKVWSTNICDTTTTTSNFICHHKTNQKKKLH